MAEGEGDDGSIVVEVTVIFIVLISISIFFEIIVALITKFMHKHKISLTYLSSIFRELTLLGLISFLLFVVASQADLDEHRKHIIEEVHMTLFLASIFYVVLVVFIGGTFFMWGRRFRYYEEHRPVATLYATSLVATQTELGPHDTPPVPHHPDTKLGGDPEVVGDYHLVARKEGTGASAKVKGWFSERQIVRERDYLAIRDWVVLKHGLAPDYPYPKYLKLCSQKLIIHLIEIDAKVWVGVAAVLGIGTLIDLASDGISETALLIIILVSEYVMLLVAIGMALKITDIIYNLRGLPVPIDSFDYGDERIHPIDDRAYDRKVKRSFKRKVKKAFLPCFDPELKRNRTAAFFWFRSRGLFRGLLQVVILSQAIYMAFFVFEGHKLIPSGAKAATIPFVILPVVIILIGFVPLVLPAFFLSAHSGDYANRKYLRQVLLTEKQEAEEKAQEDEVRVIDLSDEEDHSAAFLTPHHDDH